MTFYFKVLLKKNKHKEQIFKKRLQKYLFWVNQEDF